jgi:hypothetical protein
LLKNKNIRKVSPWIAKTFPVTAAENFDFGMTHPLPPPPLKNLPANMSTY